MARYRKRRYYRKRTRWAADISDISQRDFIISPGTFAKNITLVTQPTGANNALLTVKNVEASFELEADGANTGQFFEGLQFYIMFVPEGYNIDNKLNLQSDHPEWIMAYRFYGSAGGDIIQQTSSSLQMAGLTKGPLRVKTRLARKLNTGDRIVLYVKGVLQGDVNRTLYVNGLVRWWTKYN